MSQTTAAPAIARPRPRILDAVTERVGVNDLGEQVEIAADATKELGVWNAWHLWVVPPAEPVW